MIVHAILATAEQAWPPFVLVVGLLLIGQVAAADGLFDVIGARLARTRLRARSLLLALLALVAVVTAVLNLDTSVVFLTPVLVHAARTRGLDERPFLYGAVFMANSASLLFPGSNLTNLLVLRSDRRTVGLHRRHRRDRQRNRRSEVVRGRLDIKQDRCPVAIAETVGGNPMSVAHSR